MADSFAFSPEQVLDLKMALRRDDAVFINWLEWRVRQYLRDKIQVSNLGAFDEDLRVWLLKTSDLSGALLSHLEQARGTDLETYFQRFLDWGIEDMADFVRALVAVTYKLEEAAERNKRPRGRPADVPRIYLETEIAEVLTVRGYAVSKGRDGVFARVLAVVIAVLGAQNGEALDVFRSVKRAIDRMNKRKASGYINRRHAKLIT